MPQTEIRWPERALQSMPEPGPYAAAEWLLARHPRLLGLARRIAGVVVVESDGAPGVDLRHLADVINGIPAYDAAWELYEQENLRPDDDELERWHEAGPAPDDTVRGLGGFLPMSSGEVGLVRLLCTLATERAPWHTGDLWSLDAAGHEVLFDWTVAVRGL